MKKLVISDIHGYYDEMIRLLQYVNYIPEKDQLIVIGDMIDRGPNSIGVLNQLYSLQKRFPDKVHVLMGNHEEMMGWFFANHSNEWLKHGGGEALLGFQEFQGPIDKILTWALTRPLMYEDDEYVYVHAGIDTSRKLDNQLRSEVLWMPYSESAIRFSYVSPNSILRTTNGKKVIFGHTPAKYVFDDGAKMCIDGGIFKDDGKLFLVDLTGDRVYETGKNNKSVTSRKIARRGINESLQTNGSK